jgi:CTP:molybdopterin cytidylyltransferase MocA
MQGLILLCGGKSSRMGVPKGLIPESGATRLERQLERFREVGGEHAVIVLGYDSERYFQAIPWLRSGGDPFRRVVVNPDPEHGPFTSILEGARALDDALFVLPIDGEVPRREVWDSLAAALVEEVEAVIPCFQGTGGHPVLLSRWFLRRLRTVPVDSPEARLDRQIALLPECCRKRVEVRDPAVLTNRNEPKDFLDRPGRVG